MNKIICHSLYVSNIQNSLDFYESMLGMKILNHSVEDSKERYYLSFDEHSNQAMLELIYEKDEAKTVFPINRTTYDGYWKIALGVEDLDLARKKLIKKGITIGDAFEVPNVAYLCHFSDPDGHCIELIQHEFQANFTPIKENTNFALGSKTSFLLITYRSFDIKKSLAFYTQTLDMQLLSKMDVSQRGFDLYFLGFNDEALPNEDVTSINNVEWLWQRDFTIIELQHIHENKIAFNTTPATGFEKVTIQTNKDEDLYDPDGYKIVLKERLY